MGGSGGSSGGSAPSWGNESTNKNQGSGMPFQVPQPINMPMPGPSPYQMGQPPQGQAIPQGTSTGDMYGTSPGSYGSMGYGSAYDPNVNYNALLQGGNYQMQADKAGGGPEAALFGAGTNQGVQPDDQLHDHGPNHIGPEPPRGPQYGPDQTLTLEDLNNPNLSYTDRQYLAGRAFYDNPTSYEAWLNASNWGVPGLPPSPLHNGRNEQPTYGGQVNPVMGPQYGPNGQLGLEDLNDPNVHLSMSDQKYLAGWAYLQNPNDPKAIENWEKWKNVNTEAHINNEPPDNNGGGNNNTNGGGNNNTGGNAPPPPQMYSQDWYKQQAPGYDWGNPYGGNAQATFTDPYSGWGAYEKLFNAYKPEEGTHPLQDALQARGDSIQRKLDALAKFRSQFQG